jgi:hypothetical protein
MTEQPSRSWPAPGSAIRVVYSLDRLELLAVGILISADDDRVVMQQHADQHGPIEPFRLTVEWDTVVQLTINGPAAAPNVPGWTAEEP